MKFGAYLLKLQLDSGIPDGLQFLNYKALKKTLKPCAAEYELRRGMTLGSRFTDAACEAETGDTCDCEDQFPCESHAKFFALLLEEVTAVDM